MIELNKNQKIILIAILAVILSVIIYYIWQSSQNTEEELLEISQDIKIEKETEEIVPTTPVEIIVHIAGAVENDGIQKLPENSRVADAIEAAGGLTSDANTKNVNLAQKIVDGQKIYIPNNAEDEEDIEIIENSTPQVETTDIFSSGNGLVNINTATQTELETLPGIGPSTASKIISYRNTNGKFKSIEDIQNVSGIGDSKYAQIEDKITV